MPKPVSIQVTLRKSDVSKVHANNLSYEYEEANLNKVIYHLKRILSNNPPSVSVPEIGLIIDSNPKPDFNINSKPYNPLFNKFGVKSLGLEDAYTEILNAMELSETHDDLNPEIDNHQKMVVCGCLAELGIFSEEEEKVAIAKVKSKKQDTHQPPKGSKAVMRPLRV